MTNAIQTTRYGLYDGIEVKNKEFISITLSFASSDMNSKTFFMLKLM